MTVWRSEARTASYRSETVIAEGARHTLLPTRSATEPVTFTVQGGPSVWRAPGRRTWPCPVAATPTGTVSFENTPLAALTVSAATSSTEYVSSTATRTGSALAGVATRAALAASVSANNGPRATLYEVCLAHPCSTLTAMALRIVASRPDPAVVRLPWHQPLEEWDDEFVVPLPRGLSRHVVRIVRLGVRTYAVKETTEDLAFKEYRLLRDLQRLGLPAVRPQGVVAGRTRRGGGELPAALMTQHLAYSLPYRSLFGHGVTAERVPSLIDAMVVLLVRLHLTGFYWGDVSLSNVLFRRAAGEFAAHLVDAETGELRNQLSDRMREHDLTVGGENVFAELMDLQASGRVQGDLDPVRVVQMLHERYQVLWDELTGTEEFTLDEMWRIEQRVERLNELGFDVDELDIVTDYDGDQVVIQPKVVEAGHHARELQALTGMSVEENQARRLLNDIASFTAAHDLGREDPQVVASRWMNTVYEPISRMVPPDQAHKLEPAERFHEILEHRWHLSEQAGHEVDIFETAKDWVEHHLGHRPDEEITPDEA